MSDSSINLCLLELLIIKHFTQFQIQHQQSRKVDDTKNKTLSLSLLPVHLFLEILTTQLSPLSTELMLIINLSWQNMITGHLYPLFFFSFFFLCPLIKGYLDKLSPDPLYPERHLLCALWMLHMACADTSLSQVSFESLITMLKIQVNYFHKVLGKRDTIFVYSFQEFNN